MPTRRITAKSTFLNDGPRTGLREADPSVNTGAVENAFALNQWSGVRWSAGSVGSPIRFGRCVPKPAKSLKFVTCVTAIGTPDCRVTRVVIVQSFTSAPAHPWRDFARPLPKGKSHTTDETKRWGMSPVETSRSSVLLKLSATG